jgi:hypothetical protein
MSKTTNAHAKTGASTFEILPVPYGAALAKPMTEFRALTFHPLSHEDIEYFHMIIDDSVLMTLMLLQDWAFDGRTSYRNLLFCLGRKNAVVAWGLTALAQTDRVNRRCCFLHMALAHQDLPADDAGPA